MKEIYDYKLYYNLIYSEILGAKKYILPIDLKDWPFEHQVSLLKHLSDKDKKMKDKINVFRATIGLILFASFPLSIFIKTNLFFLACPILIIGATQEKIWFPLFFARKENKKIAKHFPDLFE